MSTHDAKLKASWRSRRVRGAVLLFFVATILMCAGVLLERGLGWGRPNEELRSQILANLKREHRSFAELVEVSLPRDPAQTADRAYNLELVSQFLSRALTNTGSEQVATAFVAPDGSLLWKKNLDRSNSIEIRYLLEQVTSTKSEAYQVSENMLAAMSPLEGAFLYRRYALPSEISGDRARLWENLSFFTGLMGLIIALSLLVSWGKLRFPTKQQEETTVAKASGFAPSKEDSETRNSLILALSLRNLLSLYDLLAPDVLVTVLDEFWRRVHLCLENSGAEFIGRPSECLVAVWSCDPPRAVLVHETTLRLSRDLEEMNVALKERGLPSLQWGLALHAGEVKRTLWSYPDHRRELGFLGSPIHETLRMCTLTRETEAQFLVSEIAMSHVSNPAAFTKSGEAWLKGRNLQLYAPIRKI